MDPRIARALATRVRPSKVLLARNVYLLLTLFQNAVVFVLLPILAFVVPPQWEWLFPLTVMITSALSAVAAFRFQQFLGEGVFLRCFVGGVAMIPGVSLIMLPALLYESYPIVRIATRERLGKCLACEYDLRQTPEGLPCPECGFRQQYSASRPARDAAR